jgi:hypothetical protein
LARPIFFLTNEELILERFFPLARTALEAHGAPSVPVYSYLVDVDSIANDSLLDTRQPQIQDNAAHVDVQAISISIQGARITGRYEDAIREHIDGSYLRHYLSDKHKWTDSAWLWIDWYSHELHLKVLKGACLFQRLKFIHDW